MRARPMIATAALAALLAGCTTGSKSASPPAGTGSSGSGSSAPSSSAQLVVAVGANPPSFDPAAQASSSSMQIMNMIVETLTYTDATGKAQPLLATSWSAAPDGLSWTFHLRTGVTFSDGEPFDAQAVQFNLDRLLNPSTYQADVNVLSVIKSVDVVDASTVRINLASKYAALPAALSFAAAGIAAPKSVTESPNTAAKVVKPVGTGPYVFGSFTANSQVTVTRNPHYWGTEPYYATQVFKIVPDAASQEALLKSGGAQVITSPEPSDLTALQNDSSYQVSFGDTTYIIQMPINTTSKSAPKLADPRVRQALNYAIDRATIISKILFGAGKEPSGPLSTLEFGACDMSDPYTYDPAKAKALLQAAGAEGMTLRMMSSNGRYPGDYQVAEAVKGYLTAVGLKVTLANPTDYSTYLSAIYVAPDKATTDLSLDGWGTYFPDANQGLLEFKSDYFPPSGYNQSYWQDAQYNSDYVAGNEATDPAARQASYCSAQKILWAAAPAIWLYQLQSPVVTVKGLSGVTIRSDSEVDTRFARP